MEFTKKLRKVRHSAGMVGMIIAMILAFYLVFEYGFEELVKYQLISVSFDALGVAVCLTIFVTIVMDKRNNVATEYLLGMLVSEALLLLCDICAWLADGIADRLILNQFSNLGLFSITLLMTVLFWEYIRLDLKIPHGTNTVFSISFFSILIVGLSLLATNGFTGLLYSIDEYTFLYERGQVWWIYDLLIYSLLLLGVSATLKYGTNERRRYAALLYAFIPLIAMAVQAIYWGCSILYISFLLVILVIYGNFYNSRGNELTMKDAELAEERFNVMFSQIQPHFLYNALTSIMNIKGNPPETKEAIADFGSYLRGNLNTISSKKPIPVSKEIEHVETYVSLEQLRFKERLKVSWHINDRRFAIPALTIQMMVENAIKHGVTQKEQGGTVTIVTEETEDGHLVKILDNGVGFVVGTVPNDGRTHVGVSSVRNRVETMSGGTLDIRSTPGKGTVVTIFIPKTPEELAPYTQSSDERP